MEKRAILNFDNDRKDTFMTGTVLKKQLTEKSKSFRVTSARIPTITQRIEKEVEPSEEEVAFRKVTLY
jgi:hypothetical protein